MTLKTDLKDIWKRRFLILTFAINDLKLRYRNSFLGFLWTIAEPLLMLTVLYLVFTNILKTDIENYAIYLLLGLVLWFFFVRATTASLASIINRGNILTKISLPREIPPISSCLTSFFMTVFEIGVFFLFMIPLQFIKRAVARRRAENRSRQRDRGGSLPGGGEALRLREPVPSPGRAGVRRAADAEGGAGDRGGPDVQAAGIQLQRVAHRLPVACVGVRPQDRRVRRQQQNPPAEVRSGGEGREGFCAGLMRTAMGKCELIGGEGTVAVV